MSPPELRVEIVDDGIGFDPGSIPADRPAHLGLAGMRERASLLGGRLDVSSERDLGTTVVAVLPNDPPILTVPSTRSRRKLRGDAITPPRNHVALH